MPRSFRKALLMHLTVQLFHRQGNRDAIQSPFAYRDAVARALLERGILVGHGDFSSGLYVADK